MKRSVISVIALAAAVSIAAAPVFARPSRAVDRKSDMLIEGRPFFTDASQYNSYFLGGSPVGLFETDFPRMSADLGYGYFGIGGEDGSYLSGQTIRMGEPGRAFFEVLYGPDFLSRRAAGGFRGADATRQRFGVTLAAQTASGFFRTSLASEGYTGKQRWKEADSSRVFMGLEKARLDMGSQPHPFVRVGAFINFTAHLDTLYTPPRNIERGERVFQTNLPEIGGSLDIGGEGIPVRSNLSAALSWSRLVYTLKGLGGYPMMPRGNEYAIANDSLQVFWLTQGRIPIVEDEYVVKPGLLIGFTANSGGLYEPHEKNDPLKFGPKVPGRNYDLGGFHFGMGSGFELLKYADIHTEYSLASMSLKCGDAYQAPVVDSRTLHHFAFGASTTLNRYLELPVVELTPRLAYFISGSAGIIGPPHSSTDPMNTYPGKSRTPLYTPREFLEGFVATSGFTTGLDASALENMLSLSYWMTFLSRKDDVSTKGGMELGLSIGFRL